MKKVMVFGVFDGIHPEHRAFLASARAEGDYLIVVVAQDHIVERLKGNLPETNMTERFAHLQEEDGVDEVVIGDSELGVWEMVKKHKPEVIALGYDQNSLKEDLEKNAEKFGYRPEIKVMPAFEPNI